MTRYYLVTSLLLLLLIVPAITVVAAPVLVPEESLDEPADPLIDPDLQLIDEKRRLAKKQSKHPLSLVSHRPNYLIGGYYFTPPQTAPFQAQFPAQDISISPVELKFQLSLKTMLVSDLIGKTGDLWVGYTNRSFWQAFNSKRSSPFRETNHEPELWFDFATDLSLGSMHFKGANLGVLHQSNGQWGETSRSWNRIYGLFMFQQGDLYFAVKPWWRLPENRRTDDNADIEKYLGNFEFYALKAWRNQSLGIMVRNNLRFGDSNHGAVQLDYTFPLYNQLSGYLQYFSGYGESLIDYDHRVNTIGFGVMLSNWL